MSKESISHQYYADKKDFNRQMSAEHAEDKALINAIEKARKEGANMKETERAECWEAGHKAALSEEKKSIRKLDNYLNEKYERLKINLGRGVDAELQQAIGREMLAVEEFKRRVKDTFPDCVNGE